MKGKSMDIALQTNMIVIRTSRKTLEQPWVNAFLANYKEELLFLSHSVIIYPHEDQEKEKSAFLSKACRLFAQKESLDATFFVRAIMCCLHYPIKIQTTDKQTTLQSIDVDVKAIDSQHVSLNLRKPDPWFNIYMQSKLHHCTVKVSTMELVFNLHNDKLKSLFERSLNRDHIFSRKIHYHYAHDFLQTLFQVTARDSNARCSHYYAILGCSQGASKDELRNSYKELVKTYHPDRIIHLDNKGQIGHYTQMFQQVQEAYHALKGA
jgi:hypothetical protein